MRQLKLHGDTYTGKKLAQILPLKIKQIEANITIAYELSSSECMRLTQTERHYLYWEKVGIEY